MKYEKPEWEVIELRGIDIIRTSPEVDDSEYGEGNSEEDGF